MFAPSGMYLPCGQPAVKIIGWKGRSDQPIPMCEMCADHNVRNRGGYLVAEVVKEDWES